MRGILKDKNIITSDDILGKDVIDDNGNSIGVITQIHIDRTDKSIIGISIDTGFMKPFAFVGIDLVKNFGVDAIYISRTPSSRFIDLLVFDRYGVKLGKIDHVTLDSSGKNLKTIAVKYSFTKKVILPAHTVKLAERNIILNINKDQFKHYINEQNRLEKAK